MSPSKDNTALTKVELPVGCASKLIFLTCFYLLFEFAGQSDNQTLEQLNLSLLLTVLAAYFTFFSLTVTHNREAIKIE